MRLMKELDFLFLYEHRVRELENLCLIKYELDKISKTREELSQPQPE